MILIRVERLCEIAYLRLTSDGLINDLQKIYQKRCTSFVWSFDKIM